MPKYVVVSHFRLTGSDRALVTGPSNSHPDQIDKGTRISIGREGASLDQLLKGNSVDKEALRLIALLNSAGRLLDADLQKAEIQQIDTEVKHEKARAERNKLSEQAVTNQLKAAASA